MKRLIHFVLAKLGYRVVRIEDGPRLSEGLDPFFALLKRFGFAPKNILDIGANRGLWTREAIKFFPEERYTLVEPQDALRANRAARSRSPKSKRGPPTSDKYSSP
jgi:hypothetical protein